MWSDQVMVEPARKITSINILAGTLFVSMLANIVLASVLGTYTSDNQCKQDRVGGITEGRVEQARIIKREERMRQQILKQHRFEEEMKDQRAEALQCARGIQAEQEL